MGLVLSWMQEPPGGSFGRYLARYIRLALRHFGLPLVGVGRHCSDRTAQTGTTSRPNPYSKLPL
jgi:hypothetical protein